VVVVVLPPPVEMEILSLPLLQHNKYYYCGSRSHLVTLRGPSFEGRKDILVDVALQYSFTITRTPDMTLEGRGSRWWW